jgi:ABC-type transport system substrate-binding protein
MSQITAGNSGMSNYPRSGLSYLEFACEKPTVSSEKVRQAIAYCLDRDGIVSDYTGNYGLRVDGYYGVGQWMYGIVNGTTDPPVDPPANPNDAAAQAAYEKELEAWDKLSLDDLEEYALDTDKASTLLKQDGWSKNADGIQEKWINGEKVTLDLTMLYPAGNRINELLEKRLLPNLEKVGIKLTMKMVSMAELMEAAYAVGDREADIIFQATNFDVLFDPALNFEVTAGKPGERNFSGQTDGELYRRALVMRETEPGDVLSYTQKWVSFQERFNEKLPMLPIYSNVYFDFYTPLLQDYDITRSSTCSEALMGAAKAEIPEVEVEKAIDSDEVEIEG